MNTSDVPASSCPFYYAGRSLDAPVRREEAWKAAGILVLRHQFTALQRQRPLIGQSRQSLQDAYLELVGDQS